MGLDITAYRQIKKREPQPAADVEVYPNGVRFRANTDFPRQAEGVEESPIVYDYAQAFDFHVGPYSGYNKMRDAVCVAVHGLSAASFWDLLAVNREPKDLHDWINFSDCEGVIGSKCAAKLAEQWRRNADNIVKAIGAEHYAVWQVAFDMASDGGAIQYH